MQPQLQQNLRNSQNFLHNAALLDALLDNSTVRPGNLVLDLGAGTGAIARRLAERGCRVLAVEQDPSLAARLRRSFPNRSGVQVCQADIRLMPLPREPYRVFSNIPFDATADIINRLTQARNPPEDAYLVVQRQAAERFVGRPTTTLVSALLAPRFEASVVHRFHRTDFTPIPRVEVVLLRLRKRGPPLLAPSDARAYRDFVVHVFAGRNSSLLHRLALLVGPRCARRLLNDLRIAGCNPAQIPPLRWLQLFTSAMAFAGPKVQSRAAGAEKRLRSHQRTLQKLHRTRQPRLRPPPLRSVAGVRILGEWQWRIRLELTTSTRRTFAARFDWGEVEPPSCYTPFRDLVRDG